MLGRTQSVEHNKLSGQVARLADRRRIRRRRAVIALFVLLLFVLSIAVYGLWQSGVRISNVTVIGGGQELAGYAVSIMNGSYFGMIPKDSIFFFPEEYIREEILSADNNIAAVSITRNGFTGLSIKIDKRTPVARWCGVAIPLPGTPSGGDCYFFDTDGIIYATTTETQAINEFVLYEDLANPSYPIGETLAFSKDFPVVFDFARQISALGSKTVSVYIHDGEVDNTLESGTKITYVLGNEYNAFTAVMSAKSNFNLSDGSVDYIDLRFNGRVYLKKKQAESNGQ
jgi:cell division septal protein FtsQ